MPKFGIDGWVAYAWVFFACVIASTAELGSGMWLGWMTAALWALTTTILSEQEAVYRAELNRLQKKFEPPPLPRVDEWGGGREGEYRRF